MISAWTRNLTDTDEIERFKNQIIGSKPVLSRLQELLDIEQAGVESKEIGSSMYDSPNWGYRQAHINGFKAAIRMVSKIITLDPEVK